MKLDFLFVVYKFDKQNELRLKGCQFWNIPYDDLEGNEVGLGKTQKCFVKVLRQKRKWKKL